MHIHHRAGAAAALALAALLTLGACGSNNSTATKPSTVPATTPAATSAPGAATQAVAAPSINTLQVEAKDYSYDISGTAHAGLVTITFKNTGQYAHEMSLSKLKDGKTLADVKAAFAQPDGEVAAQALLENPEAELSGPATIGPNLSVTTTAKLGAGHYVVTCFLPGPDGMPHVAMGMLGEVTIAGDNTSGGNATAAAPPNSAGTVEVTDAAITVPPSFAHGGTYTVHNAGSKPHDFSVAKLKDQPLPAFFQCVGGSFEKNTPIDGCPGTLQGGVSFLAPGDTAYLTVAALPPGNYGYVSTAGDAGADFAAGLNGTFTVQ